LHKAVFPQEELEMKDGPFGRGPWALFALAVACVGAPPPVRLSVVGSASEPAPPRETPSQDMPLRPHLDAGVRPERYTVELTVDPRQETFSGLVEIDVALAEPTRQVWLRGHALTVRGASVSARGTTRPARVVRHGEELLGLLLERPVGPGPARLRVAWQGSASQGEASGLLRHEEAGRWYARLRPGEVCRVVPTFGGPALPPVPWHLTLRMPPENRAFTELPVAAEEVGPEGLRTVRFQTQARPGTSLAFAVGPPDSEEGALHPGPAASRQRGGRGAASA
jgi:alanyl aminopeptidase